MKRARNLLLAAASLLAACQAAGPGCDLERMIDQRRYRSYQATTWFPDGRVMRTPPGETVPRERPAGSATLLEGRDEAGAYATAIPIPRTHALFARGRERFEIFCAPCHGVRGDGDSKVAMNMTLRKPPSLLSSRVREFAPGHIHYIITHGYGLMRSYQGELGVEDRWAVVAYVQALQLSQGASLDELPPPIRSEAQEKLK